MAQTAKTSTKLKAPKRTKSEGVDEIVLPKANHLSNRNKVFIGIGLVCVVLIISAATVQITYANRIYPGVRGLGTYLGGLNYDQAVATLNTKTTKYQSQSFIISDNSSLKVTPKELGVTYDNEQLVNEVMKVGRSGNIISNAITQFSHMIGFGQDNYSNVNIDPEKFAALYVKTNATATSPVENAKFVFNLPTVEIGQQKQGTRLDPAVFSDNLLAHLGTLSTENLSLLNYSINPSVSSDKLVQYKDAAQNYSSSDLILSYGSRNWTISREEIISWIGVRSSQSNSDLLNNYYKGSDEVTVDLNQASVKAYLESIAPQINAKAVDAELTVADGRATVFTQARDGATLQIAQSQEAITKTLANSSNGNSPRNLALVVAVQKADVRNETIEQLGIRELLAEGVSTFPGSSAARITNIKVGARRYNGVLLKPGQVFSFGELLGEVGPAQGYLPGRVILEGRQENQYGGGLCQVSTTAFRAALLAGLPILERHNHAFAVSYYTSPFGVPGVDAAIYYPAQDFKFKNDTANHILIQTEVVGTTIKFRYYGTKEKEGTIRGPSFISGSNDPNQPSSTVFYRDVVQGGQVVKTDTFRSNYKSAADFPPVQ